MTARCELAATALGSSARTEKSVRAADRERRQGAKQGNSCDYCNLDAIGAGDKDKPLCPPRMDDEVPRACGAGPASTLASDRQDFIADSALRNESA